MNALPLVLVAGLGLACLTAIFVSDGNIAVAVTPVLLALIIFAAIKAPLRQSMLVLSFLCLTLENHPSEAFASDKWRSPLATVGALMLNHLNVTIPVKALLFSGVDLALLLLAGIWAARRMSGSTVDIRGHVPPAPPLRRAALICLVAIGVFWLFGMSRPDFSFQYSLWQVHRAIYLPCVFLLFCAALRGPEDARPLGMALIAAALLRAAAAVYVRQMFPNIEEVPHATTHADSMLFADAFLLILVIFFQRPIPKNFWLATGTLPLLTWGMVANNRRLVWMELLVGLLVLYFLTPMTRLKRHITRAVVFSIPVLALYGAAGWNHATGIFAPLRTIRSMVDSGVDTSTLWRDLENFNLYSTLRLSPLVGCGYGHEYVQAIHLILIDVDPVIRYCPHNSILGLLAFLGVVGFSAIWMMMPLGFFFAVLSFDLSTAPRDRTIALTAIGVLVVYLVHCYGDMGFGTWTSIFTVGPVLALIAKQAVSIGAWPLHRRAARTSSIAL